MAIFLLAANSSAAEPATKGSDYLDNGQIRIGVDFAHGGAISYLADATKRENVINVSDCGRYVSQSYYSGPVPFGPSHPAWPHWPWNPVSAGDVYRHPSELLEHRNDGRELYVKSRPKQWALNDVAGECTFESWITLDGRTAQIRCRLSNARSDHAQYRGFDQELPAVYTIAPLHRLIAYDGDEPFADRKVSEIPPAPLGPPKWASFRATEYWAALVDQHDWGLGVFHPGVIRFKGGFFGTPGSGGPNDSPTGYIAPLRPEVLDHDIVYEYQFSLILDTLANIRRYAVEHRPAEARPDYRFHSDRQHWCYRHAIDAGQPIRGLLHVNVDHDDPQLVGPESFWDAKAVPKLYIRAAYHTQKNSGQVFWRGWGDADFGLDRSQQFSVQTDGKMHTYEIDLSSVPSYRGKITRLRFDPVDSGTAGEYVDVAWISYKRE